MRSAKKNFNELRLDPFIKESLPVLGNTTRIFWYPGCLDSAGYAGRTYIIISETENYLFTWTPKGALYEI
jgi:hypothetical protein